MRVPADPQNPTFDNTIKVSFGRWFTSSAADRREWTRRRKAATKVANAAGGPAHHAAVDSRRQRLAERYPAQQPQVRHAAQPPAAVPVDPTMRTVTRLAKVQLWLTTIQLAVVLVPLIIVLVIIVAVVWILFFA